MTETAREAAERILAQTQDGPVWKLDAEHSTGLVIDAREVATAYLQALDRLALAEGVVEAAKVFAIDERPDYEGDVPSDEYDLAAEGATIWDWGHVRKLRIALTRYEEGAKG